MPNSYRIIQPSRPFQPPRSAPARCRAEAAWQLTLVRGRDLARRVIAVGELGRDVELRTATVVRAPDALANPVEVRIELAGRVAQLTLRHAVPGRPEVLVLAGEERRDELVFRSEMTVEARLCDAGFLNHEIDADGVDTATIEQLRRCLQDPLPHTGPLAACVLSGFARRALGHSQTSARPLAHARLTHNGPVCSVLRTGL